MVFVIFDRFQVLDLAGPSEVFQHASDLTGGYECLIAAPLAGLVTSSSGLPVQARLRAAVRAIQAPSDYRDRFRTTKEYA